VIITVYEYVVRCDTFSSGGIQIFSEDPPSLPEFRRFVRRQKRIFPHAISVKTPPSSSEMVAYITKVHRAIHAEKISHLIA
jgi:hypothetical protein